MLSPIFSLLALFCCACALIQIEACQVFDHEEPFSVVCVGSNWFVNITQGESQQLVVKECGGKIIKNCAYVENKDGALLFRNPKEFDRCFLPLSAKLTVVKLDTVVASAGAVVSCKKGLRGEALCCWARGSGASIKCMKLQISRMIEVDAGFGGSLFLGCERNKSTYNVFSSEHGAISLVDFSHYLVTIPWRTQRISYDVFPEQFQGICDAAYEFMQRQGAE
jgi:hypothetical protein